MSTAKRPPRDSVHQVAPTTTITITGLARDAIGRAKSGVFQAQDRTDELHREVDAQRLVQSTKLDRLSALLLRARGALEQADNLARDILESAREQEASNVR